MEITNDAGGSDILTPGYQDNIHLEPIDKFRPKLLPAIKAVISLDPNPHDLIAALVRKEDLEWVKDQLDLSVSTQEKPLASRSSIKKVS